MANAELTAAVATATAAATATGPTTPAGAWCRKLGHASKLGFIDLLILYILFYFYFLLFACSVEA